MVRVTHLDFEMMTAGHRHTYMVVILLVISHVIKEAKIRHE